MTEGVLDEVDILKGAEKYYSITSGDYDIYDAGFEFQDLDDFFVAEEKELDYFFKEPKEEVTRSYVRPLGPYAGIEIRRASHGELGYGVLGRCFPYDGVIEIRYDLYGDDFHEVLTHELIHWKNPHWSESEVRTQTRLTVPFSPKWH